MKASYYLGGLALGILAGGVVGYIVASNPRNRVRVRRFFNDVEDKAKDISDKVKCACGYNGGDLTEEELLEIETVLANEAIADAQAKAK
ncbi:hypothetical protein M2138_000944 [Dysgonomonadaceae bacterium PH5-43]|nr:hypothetical protein [Dysgonomonadaceae bacterium PH5-43]